MATLAVLLLALLSIVHSGIPSPWRWLLLAVVALLAGWRLGRQAGAPVHAVLWRADGGVTLTLRNGLRGGGGEVEAALEHARVLGPLIVMELRPHGRARETLWLLPDNLDAETRRRLRVRVQSRSHDDTAIV